MRFFRLKWLQRILLFPLLVLLSAGLVDLVEQQGDGEGELVIHATQFFGKLTSSLQESKIKFGFDVVSVSVVTALRKIISDDYISGVSIGRLPVYLPTYTSRGPPCLIAIL
jgi:hypothetical protein